jgi:hypothetical protein
MKRIIFCVICFCIGTMLFSEEGIVTDNNVRIRENPNLNGKIVGHLNRCDFVTIYHYEGTGYFCDEVLDLWACISENNDKWINAYWITVLPFDYYDESECDTSSRITPRTISAYNKAKNNFEVIIWNLEKKDIEKYINVPAGELTFTQGQARSNFFIQKIMLSSDLQKIDTEGNRSLSDDKTEAYYLLNGVRIREQVFRANEWNWSAYVDDVSIENDEIKCIFGIHTGMQKSEILGFFGKPYSEDKNTVIYGFELKGGITMLSFKVKNNIIKSIEIHKD